MKNLLQKSLSKLLLLVLFVFGGCEMFRGFNQTVDIYIPDTPTTHSEPSNALIYLIGGYTIALLTKEVFHISSNAKTYTSSILFPEEEKLSYVDGEDDWATYEGETILGYVKVILEDIQLNEQFDPHGYFTMYVDGEIYISKTFF